MSYHLQSPVPSCILKLGSVGMRSLALNDQCFSNSVSLVLTFLAALVLRRGQQKCCCSRSWAFPVRGLIRGPQNTLMPPACTVILTAWLTTAQASWKSHGECFSNSVALNDPQIYKIWPPLSSSFPFFFFFFFWKSWWFSLLVYHSLVFCLTRSTSGTDEYKEEECCS